VKNKLIIAIDGPVGSGKSTVARRVAEMLGYIHLDSGAMYRAVAWKALCEHIPLDSTEQLAALASSLRIDLEPRNGKQHVILDGEDITEWIGTPEVSHAASMVAVVPGVRHPLVSEQRRAGAQGGVVMEGRDIGTVVFPDADVKFFLTALPQERAQRRFIEERAVNTAANFEETFADMTERDQRDSSRTDSPLKIADDAVVIDSTGISIEQVLERMMTIVRERIAGTKQQAENSEQ